MPDASDARIDQLIAEVSQVARAKALPLSPRLQFKARAIRAWQRACSAISGIRTEQARAISADESTLRDWESLHARQVVPLWAAFALPREAKAELIQALAEDLKATG